MAGSTGTVRKINMRSTASENRSRSAICICARV
jgi:hypothetical protein